MGFCLGPGRRGSDGHAPTEGRGTPGTGGGRSLPPPHSLSFPGGTSTLGGEGPNPRVTTSVNRSVVLQLLADRRWLPFQRVGEVHLWIGTKKEGGAVVVLF